VRNRSRMAVLVGLALYGLAVPAAARQKPDPDPGRFAAEIEAFAQWDQKNSAPRDAVLFAGSSSIRFWPTAERFPGRAVINRGFGGSHISDVNHFVRETVLKYAPAVVVFYAGDNDIGDGKSPERVLADYQTFVGKVLAARADTEIVFVAIKPSLARWSLWPAMKDANARIQAWSASRPHLHFADIAPPMLGADGKPNPSLFKEDGLHMTPAGYDVWTGIVGGTIEAIGRGGSR
jgi:lysophospholipase L1-like esterase